MLPSLEEHYSQLLGLTEDWCVSDIELSTTEQRIVIEVEFSGDQHACPKCGSTSPVYDQRGDKR